MQRISGLIAVAAGALALTACQTHQNGATPATGPTLAQMLERADASTPTAAPSAPMKPGETLLAQTGEGWKVIYADIRNPGKPPFRYCAMDWTSGGAGGVTFQVSQDSGLRVILETNKRSFSEKAPLFAGTIRFSNGITMRQQFQAVTQHVAWIPPGSFDASSLMRHLGKSASVSLNDSRGSMLDVPTRTAGDAIQAFNQCTLKRL